MILPSTRQPQDSPLVSRRSLQHGAQSIEQANRGDDHCYQRCSDKCQRWNVEDDGRHSTDETIAQSDVMDNETVADGSEKQSKASQ